MGNRKWVKRVKRPGESGDLKKLEILMSEHKRNPDKRIGNGRERLMEGNEGWMCVEMGV